MNSWLWFDLWCFMRIYVNLMIGDNLWWLFHWTWWLSTVVLVHQRVIQKACQVWVGAYFSNFYSHICRVGFKQENTEKPPKYKCRGMIWNNIEWKGMKSKWHGPTLFLLHHSSMLDFCLTLFDIVWPMGFVCLRHDIWYVCFIQVFLSQHEEYPLVI